MRDRHRRRPPMHTRRHAVTRGGLRCMNPQPRGGENCHRYAGREVHAARSCIFREGDRPGAMAARMPSARLTHSSHSLKATIAPSAPSAIAEPVIQAFQAAVASAVKSSAQGASARHTPRTTFTTSMTFSLMLSVVNLSNMTSVRFRHFVVSDASGGSFRSSAVSFRASGTTRVKGGRPDRPTRIVESDSFLDAVALQV